MSLGSPKANASCGQVEARIVSGARNCGSESARPGNRPTADAILVCYLVRRVKLVCRCWPMIPAGCVPRTPVSLPRSVPNPPPSPPPASWALNPIPTLRAKPGLLQWDRAGKIAAHCHSATTARDLYRDIAIAFPSKYKGRSADSRRIAGYGAILQEVK